MKFSRAFLAFLLLAASASAASITWDVANANNNWNTTDANWTSGATFVTGDDVIFSATTGETVTINAADVNPTSTTVGAGNGSWTFTGSKVGGTLTKTGTGTLTLSATNAFTAASINGGPNSQTSGAIQIGAAGALGSGTITFGNTGTMTALFFQSGFGSNTLSNNIAFASGAVQTNLLATANVSQTISLGGVISGGNAGATLFLNNNAASGVAKFRITNTGNTVLGTWRLNRGALEFTSDAALGDPANDLNLDVGNTVAGVGLAFGANGISTGAGRTVTLTSATVIDTGTFTGSTILGQIVGAATITRRGTTSLVPANNSNTHSGGWTIATAPAASSAQGSLHVTAASLNGSSVFSGLGTGAITATSAGTILSSAVTGTASNNIVLPNTATRHELVAANATELTLSGVISGGGASIPTFFVNTNQGGGSTGLIKLTNTNTFTGKIQINRGGLAINSDAALGNATNPVVVDVGTATQVGLRFDAAFNSARSIQLGAGKQVFDTNGNNIGLSGVISNLATTGDLFKAGSGKLTLSGTNTYTGTTTVNAGSLEIGAGGTTGIIGSGSVTNNGSISFNRSNALALSNTISGSGSLSQDGAGTTTLSGASSYIGSTTVNAGVLNVTGSLSASTALDLAGGEFRLGTALDLIGSLTTSTVTQSGGTLSLDVSGSQSDLVTVTGNYTQTSGGITVNLVSAPTEGVPYTIVAYTGTLSANPPVTFTGLSGSRLTGNVDYGTGSNSAITVTFVGVPASLVWSGATSNTWDVNTTQNWKNGATPDSFFQQDSVTFDDSPTSGNFSPVVDFSALCGSVVFNNSSNTYTLTGTGGISGATQIQMTGSGTTILATNNTNTGQVTVSSGTLQIGNGGTAGSLGSGDVIVDASLVFNRSDDSTLSSAVFGTGTVTKLGAGTLTVTGALGQIGDLTISSGAVSLGNGGTTGNVTSANIVNHGNLTINRSANLTLSNVVSGSGSLSKLGAATLTLPTANGYAGGTSLNGGNLNLGNTAAIGSGALTVGTSASTGTTTTAMLVTNSLTTSAVIANDITLPADTVASNRALYMYGVGNGTNTLDLSGKISGGSSLTTLFLNNDQIGAFNPQFILSNPTNDFTARVNINRGGLRIASNEALGNTANVVVFDSNGGADLTFLSAMTYTHATTLTSNTDFDTGANDVTASGVISGVAGITKIGSGALILSSANTYTGATTVNAGTLQVNGTLSTSAATVTVSATGTLSGVGTINRPVTVSGTIAPGNGVGTLSVVAATTVNGTLAAEIDGAAADKLAVTGNLSLGASSALTLNLLPNGFTQPSYVIAECTGTLSGTFATVPSGYTVTYTSTQAILTPATGFTSWASAKGLDGMVGKESGPSDDPDKDGLANLLEYMLDGDPLGGSLTILPAVTKDATTLTLTFNRRDDSETDTTQVVEFGSTLTGWTPVAIPSASGTSIVTAGGKSVSFTLTENGTDPDLIVVEIPVGTDTTLFARVKVSN